MTSTSSLLTTINPDRQRDSDGRQQVSDGSRSGKMIWDISVIDKLLYLVNTIILIICGVVLLFLIKPLGTPHKSILCSAPHGFSSSDIPFVQSRCISADSNLAVISDDDDMGKVMSNDSYWLKGEDVFPAYTFQPYISNLHSDFSSPMFLMAIFSLLPLLCWRLIGSMDGRDFISHPGQSSTTQTARVALWFLITKAGATLLCTLFLVKMFELNAQSVEYSNALEYNTQPESLSVFCNYTVRRAGNNIARYLIPCIVSKGQDDSSYILNSMFGYEHLLTPIISSLQIWLIVMTAIHALNLLASAVLFATCTMRSYRVDFIHRNSRCHVDKDKCEKIDGRLGTSGVMVFTLAMKLGHGEKIRDVLTDLCEK